MNDYKVYIHVFPNDKVYVGITCQEPKKRWGLKGNGYKNNKHFYNAIQKYGWDNIIHKIIFNNLTIEQAFQKEKELIELYKSTNKKYGYNHSIGGEIGPKGCKHTKEMNERKSKYMKEHPNKGQFKKGMLYGKQFKKNDIPWNKNRKMTNEEIEKNRLSHLGKHYSIQTEFKSKKTLCIETNVIYNGTIEASEMTNICQSSIAKACRGAQKTAGGYHWKYI